MRRNSLHPGAFLQKYDYLCLLILVLSLQLSSKLLALLLIVSVSLLYHSESEIPPDCCCFWGDSEALHERCNLRLGSCHYLSLDKLLPECMSR